MSILNPAQTTVAREDVLEVGRIGAWVGLLAVEPAAQVREAAKALERAGYDVLWYGESVAREAFGFGALLLEATDHVRIASGIANLWARDATAMHNGAATLAEASGGRFILGIGVSHRPLVIGRGHDYRDPLGVMAEYLDAYDTALYRGPEPVHPAPLVLAALGPRMLSLASGRTCGAHSYFVPVEHTTMARRVLGPGPWLAAEQAAVLSSDPVEARIIAHAHMETYLRLPNYRNNLSRLGWTPEDLDEVPDRLIDALIVWGGVGDIVERVAEHLRRGVDHVAVQLLPVSSGFPLRDYVSLAPALAELQA